MIHWEEIKHENDFLLIRAKVIGGWLVIAECAALTSIENFGEMRQEPGHQFRQSMVFVPDPSHVWDIEYNY